MSTPSVRYRKKPSPVEARQLTDMSFRDLVNALTVEQFAAGGEDSDGYMFIEVRTLEGVVRAKEGDWIVWGNHGDVWPVRGDIFAETYEDASLPVDGQAYDGELAMLRSLVRTLRAVSRDDRADVAQREVRRLLYEHAADERDAYRREMSSTAEGDTARKAGEGQ